ncbi:hypothetical protein ASF09_18210 [Sphingomonas sp. Leaf242]|nr:hypothetical protein ASF09_18210 [Sphingomonas sp. Leaf242]
MRSRRRLDGGSSGTHHLRSDPLQRDAPDYAVVILTKVRIQGKRRIAFVALDPDFRQDDGVQITAVETAFRRRSVPSMFSREGGSPVWAPAFAGEQL